MQGAHHNLYRCYNAKGQAVWTELLFDLLLGDSLKLTFWTQASECHWLMTTCSYAQMCVERLISFVQLQRFSPSAKGLICLVIGINQKTLILKTDHPKGKLKKLLSPLQARSVPTSPCGRMIFVYFDFFVLFCFKGNFLLLCCQNFRFPTPRSRKAPYK